MISGKNILLINAKSGDYGGMEFHILDLVKVFSKANNVYVFCPKGPICKDYKNAGAKVINQIPKAPYDFKYALFVKQFCKQHRIHVVHAHELISAQGLLGAFLARTPARIWHVHTPFLLWKHPTLKAKIIKNTFNWITNFFTANLFATKVIALTPEIKKHRVRLEWVLPFKVVVIPNAIDTKRFSKNVSTSKKQQLLSKYNIPNNKIIIGNLSRTSAEKGQMVLLKAFSRINKKYPNKYFLVITGGGKLEKSLRTYGEKHFDGSFKITGSFNELDKATFYHIYDYFVFPSLAEGFGYVLVEAMSSGLPVLASNLPVLQNVGGKGVIFFKTGNEVDLFNNLENLLKMPEVAIKNLVKQNIEKVQGYGLDSFAQNYSMIYDQRS